MRQGEVWWAEFDARRAFVSSSSRGRRYMVFYCLSPDGIRAGFPSPRLRRLLPRSQRGRSRGTVVLALTWVSLRSL